MITSQEKEGELTITLNNGHFELLKKIVQDYSLKDPESAVIFALSVLSDGEGKPISNAKGSWVPSDQLKIEPTKV